MNQLKKVLGASFFLPITFKVISISNWTLVKWLKFMFSKESTKNYETFTAHRRFDVYLVLSGAN